MPSSSLPMLTAALLLALAAPTAARATDVRGAGAAALGDTTAIANGGTPSGDKATPPPMARLPLPALPARWRSEADLSASSVGGTPSQALMTGGFSVRREGNRWDTRVAARWTYGQATDANDVTAVTRRSWITQVNVEPRASRVGGAYASMALERSLEQRFDLRARLEAGVRWAIVRAPVATAAGSPGAPAASAAIPTRLDVTFAASGEHLAPLPDAPSSLGQRAIPRWSVRASGKRALADRVTLEHETTYRPILAHVTRTTLDTRTRVAVRIAQGTDMTLTGQTQLDTDARARGAPSNAVSQVTFGIALRR